jgi:hypothetical protein
MPSLPIVFPDVTPNENAARRAARFVVEVFGLVGGAREDRTPDLLNAIQALSHLSYDPFTKLPHRGTLRMGAV